MNFTFAVSKGSASMEGGTAFSDYIHGRNVERIRAMTEADFDDLTVRTPTTMYLVTTTNGVKLYLGDISLYSDSIPADIEALIRNLSRQTDANTSAIADLDASAVRSSTLMRAEVLTQEEYDELETKDEGTAYFICESEQEESE